MFITVLVLRNQHAIVRAFEQIGAMDAASALTPAELGLKPGLAWHQLVGQAVLRCPGEGRYYLHAPSWQRLRRQWRLTALLVGAVIVVILALLFWLRVKSV
jgi:hypothetical protein